MQCVRRGLIILYIVFYKEGESIKKLCEKICEVAKLVAVGASIVYDKLCWFHYTMALCLLLAALSLKIYANGDDRVLSFLLMLLIASIIFVIVYIVQLKQEKETDRRIAQRRARIEESLRQRDEREAELRNRPLGKSFTQFITRSKIFFNKNRGSMNT